LWLEAHSGLGRGHTPDTDDVVGVSSEESLAISSPGKGQHIRGGLRLLLAGSSRDDVRLQLLNEVLGLQVPDLDGWASGSNEPVSVGAECKGIGGVIGGEGVKVLALVEVPEHNSVVLAARRAERTIRRDSNGVDISAVANVIRAELAVVQVPNLDLLIPTGRNDDGVGGGGRETNAGNPLGVVVLSDGVLALSKGVPQLDGLVARCRDNLTVVSRESNAQDVTIVSSKWRAVAPVLMSQRRRVRSHDPERANCPSDEMTTSEMK